MWEGRSDMPGVYRRVLRGARITANVGAKPGGTLEDIRTTACRGRFRPRPERCQPDTGAGLSHPADPDRDRLPGRRPDRLRGPADHGEAARPAPPERADR